MGSKARKPFFERNSTSSSDGKETRVGKIPWRREWLPTAVFLPRESHGQRSLVGTSISLITNRYCLLSLDKEDFFLLPYPERESTAF